MANRLALLSLVAALAACGAPGSGPFAPSALDPEPFVPEGELLPGCTDAEKRYAKLVPLAADKVWAALMYINKASDPQDRAFRLWFDSVAPPLMSEVRADVGLCLERMHANGFARGFKIQCDPDARFPMQLPCTRKQAGHENDPPTAAFALPDGDLSDTIFVCPILADAVEAEQIGTFIHEVSHWKRTCSTDDIAITQAEAQSLNGTPMKAIKNGANYEFGVPAMAASIQCTAAPGQRRGGASLVLLAPLVSLLLLRKRIRSARRLAWAIPLISALLASGCAHRPVAHRAAPRPWRRIPPAVLVCHLDAVRSEVSAGEPVQIRMELENTSNEGIVFLNFGTPFEWPSFADQFAVREGSGTELSYHGFVASRRLSQVDFDFIPPGERRGATLNLAPLYGIDAPGTYEITYRREIQVQPWGIADYVAAPSNGFDPKCPKATIVVKPRAP